MPVRNVHKTPETHFLIARQDIAKAMNAGELVGVLHSHTRADPSSGAGLCPSEADTVSQIDSGLPFYVTALSGRRNYMDFFSWGDELPTPPIGERIFRHAMTDCYALVRHAYFNATGIVLKDFPRPLSWWDSPNGPNPIEDGLSNSGWVEIPSESLQPGDGLLFALRGGIIQHCGLYVGGDLFLHHLHGRLSSVDPLPQWRRFLRKSVRYAPGAQ